MKKNIKMTNFAPCGPIFKIRNSKLVYSKSYNQITDNIFFITSTFRLLLCYFVHFYTQRSRILKNQHCCPTVQWGSLLGDIRQQLTGIIPNAEKLWMEKTSLLACFPTFGFLAGKHIFWSNLQHKCYLVV